MDGARIRPRTFCGGSSNGELDGVNPKIIVLLAGTNNVGDHATAEDVTRGLEAIVRVMQAKAPDATLIVTAVFPRNDHMEMLPVIERINGNLAKLADGKRIRFLNINDRLADGEGRLFEGMMDGDKLHPTVKAYQIWADALKPVFTELLGTPGQTSRGPG